MKTVIANAIKNLKPKYRLALADDLALESRILLAAAKEIRASMEVVSAFDVRGFVEPDYPARVLVDLETAKRCLN